MTDLSTTVAPKSDQLNADDLIAGPKTIRITNVSANEANPDQPINISFEGDSGKPFRPCKSMRRVMIAVWGADGKAYTGRSMTLYRDPSVQFGGMQVGGIRISHMSHIEKPVTMALTATRAQRKPYTVKPISKDQAAPSPDKLAASLIREIEAVTTEQALIDLWTGRLRDPAWTPVLKREDVQAAKNAAKKRVCEPDPFGVPGDDEISPADNLSNEDLDRLIAEREARA